MSFNILGCRKNIEREAADLAPLRPGAAAGKAKCRQLPSTSTGATARCSDGSLARCISPGSPPVAMAIPPPASPVAPGAGGGLWAAAEAALRTLCLRLRCLVLAASSCHCARYRRRAVPLLLSSRGASSASPSSSAGTGSQGAIRTARCPGTTDRCEKLPPPSLRLELDENCHSILPPHGLACLHSCLACQHTESIGTGSKSISRIN